MFSSRSSSYLDFAPFNHNTPISQNILELSVNYKTEAKNTSHLRDEQSYLNLPEPILKDASIVASLGQIKADPNIFSSIEKGNEDESKLRGEKVKKTVSQVTGLEVDLIHVSGAENTNLSTTLEMEGWREKLVGRVIHAAAVIAGLGIFVNVCGKLVNSN